MTPIQETLTGVTFPGSGLLNVNTIPNPLQYFGSLLQLWIEADAGVTPDGGGGANAWADQSSYHRNLIVDPQSPGNPAITPAAQNGLQGVTAIQSGAANTGTFLRTAYNAALDFLASTPFSVVMAYKPAAPPGGTVYGGEIGNFNYTSTASQGWVVGTVSAKLSLRLINNRGVAECSAATSASLALGTAYIAQLINSGSGLASGIQIYLNNVLQATTVLFDNLGGASTQNSLKGVGAPCAGSGAYGVGRSTVLEAAVITKAMNAHDVAVMDAYLNAKWAIHA